MSSLPVAAPAEVAPTSLDFVSVQVRDLQASRTFYAETLGFAPASQGRPDAVVFQTQSGAIFAIRTLLVAQDAASLLGGGVGLWFAHAEVEALHERVTHQGAHVVRPPQDGPFGRMFTVSDPDGYALTFHQPA